MGKRFVFPDLSSSLSFPPPPPHLPSRINRNIAAAVRVAEFCRDTENRKTPISLEQADRQFGLNADGDRWSWRSLRAGLALKPAQNIEFSFHSLHFLLVHFCRRVVPLTVTLEALAIFHFPIEILACAIAREPFLDGALAHGEIGSKFFKHNAKVEFLSF